MSIGRQHTVLRVSIVQKLLAMLFVVAPWVASASSRDSQAYTEVRDILIACQAFHSQYGIYPPESVWLDELTGSENATINTERLPFLHDSVAEDPWGHPYVYRYPGKFNTIDVHSVGHDGVSLTGGGDVDDISSWSVSKPWISHYHSSLPRRLWLLITIAFSLLLVFFRTMRKHRTRSDDLAFTGVGIPFWVIFMLSLGLGPVLGIHPFGSSDSWRSLIVLCIMFYVPIGLVLGLVAQILAGLTERIIRAGRRETGSAPRNQETGL